MAIFTSRGISNRELTIKRGNGHALMFSMHDPRTRSEWGMNFDSQDAIDIIAAIREITGLEPAVKRIDPATAESAFG